MAGPTSVDKRKTAVIILEYQIRVIGYYPKERQNELISKANLITAAARQAGIPVIFVEVQKGERTPDTEFHPQLVRLSGEVVLTKKKSGPFTTTNLDERMKKQGIDTLVLIGVNTSGSVLSTVRGAADLDYKLFVISDCCADRDEEVQRVLMEKVFYHQSTVITAQVFLELLEKS